MKTNNSGIQINGNLSHNKINNNVSNLNIDKTTIRIRKKSFWKGFIIGVTSSLIANFIWHYIHKLLNINL